MRRGPGAQQQVPQALPGGGGARALLNAVDAEVPQPGPGGLGSVAHDAAALAGEARDHHGVAMGAAFAGVVIPFANACDQHRVDAHQLECVVAGVLQQPLPATTCRFAGQHDALEARFARHSCGLRQRLDGVPDVAASHLAIEDASLVIGDHQRVLVIAEIDADDRGIERNQGTPRRQVRMTPLHTDRHERETYQP